MDATPQNSWLEAFAMQRRVIVAIMLRNIRVRYFGHGLGYLVAVAWPIVHILIVLALYAVFSRGQVFGESAILFIATGTVPFMAFSYLSRFMLVSLMYARPLLAFPQVKILDVLLATALLEFLTTCLVVILMVLLAIIFDVPFWPNDIVEATYAMFAALLLGVGFGLFNGVVMIAAPIWFTVYALATVVLWVISGVAFLPSATPEPFRTIISYNPILHCVEWMRVAYYSGYSSTVLDKTYAISWGLGSIIMGLLVERGARGFLLAARG